MPYPPAIDVRDLRVVRGGREVLHGSSVGVRSGSVTGLLGPSGCGKSPLMRVIVSVQMVQGGEVGVLGGGSATSPRRRRRSTAISASSRTCGTSRP